VAFEYISSECDTVFGFRAEFDRSEVNIGKVEFNIREKATLNIVGVRGRPYISVIIDEHMNVGLSFARILFFRSCFFRCLLRLRKMRRRILTHVHWRELIEQRQRDVSRIRRGG
jgi:hypothetical protein